MGVRKKPNREHTPRYRPVFNLLVLPSQSIRYCVEEGERNCVIDWRRTRPHSESWGASALNFSHIINVGLADQQPHQGTAEDTVFSVFPVSYRHLPHFFSLRHLIFSNTASSFLFINLSQSISPYTQPCLLLDSFPGRVFVLASSC